MHPRLRLRLLLLLLLLLLLRQPLILRRSPGQ
jgi:hypothetical protein